MDARPEMLCLVVVPASTSSLASPSVERRSLWMPLEVVGCFAAVIDRSLGGIETNRDRHLVTLTIRAGKKLSRGGIELPSPRSRTTTRYTDHYTIAT